MPILGVEVIVVCITKVITAKTAIARGCFHVVDRSVIFWAGKMLHDNGGFSGGEWAHLRGARLGKKRLRELNPADAIRVFTYCAPKAFMNSRV